MKPEGSLPHSQEPANCPYPEPDRSSPYTPISLLGDPFKYYPSIYVWIIQVVLFTQVSPQKPCMHLSNPDMCYMPCPSYYNIRWGVQSIKLPCYLIPLKPKYPPQHPILENPQPTFLPQCEWPSFPVLQTQRYREVTEYAVRNFKGMNTVTDGNIFHLHLNEYTYKHKSCSVVKKSVCQTFKMIKTLN